MTEELEQVPEAAPEAEKPKRRTRTKKAETLVADAPVAAAEAAVVEEAPKKTTTRKRATKKAAPAEAPAEVPSELASVESAPEAAQEAPAPKKTTTRKRTVKKAEEKPAEASEPVEAPKSEASKAEVSAAEKPVEPSVPAEPAAEGAAEPAVAATEPSEVRKPRQRRTRVAKEQVETSADAPAAGVSVAGASAASAPETTAVEAADSSFDASAPAEQPAGEGQAPAAEKLAKQEGAESAEGSSHGKRNKKNRDRDRGQQGQQQNQQPQNQGKNGKQDRNDHRRQRRQHGNREVLPSISRDEFAEMKVGDLREKAAEYGIDASGYRKAELIDVVFEALCKAEGIIEVMGILDIMNDGYGFLRTKGYLPSEGDAYVSLSIIRRNNLRKGDFVVGLTRPPASNEKYAAIQKVISVNGIPIDELGGRPRFADLTPIYPDERLIMEHGKSGLTARIIDLISPIGKGQRGLIVSPPKAGKTTVLKDVAAAIIANNPEVHLMCLLVDERPEEVTDMERSIKGEVISSTFDMPCENHIAVAELVIERAKRLVEQGKDVVILLDSITRLARAYNMGTPASGRILSGGVDSSALYPPKRFLGAARNIENGGSLTILGTALVDTGSKMDEVIFEEYKGTGNMEIRLDRNLADRRIFPAIDPITSGTRKEELLLNPQEAPLIWAVRRVLSNLNNTERAMDTLIKSLKQTENNQEFLIRFARKAQTSTKPEDGLAL